VLPVVLGVVLAEFGRYALALGPTAAMRVAVGAGAGVTVGLLLPRLLGSRGRGTVTAVSGIVLASVLGVVLASTVRGGDLGAVGTITTADLLVALVLTGHLAVGSAVIATIRGDRIEVRRELLRLLGPDGLNAAVDRARDRLRRRELAEHLHADLQNRLLASLHRLDRLAGDEAAVLAELAEVQRQLGLAGGLSVVDASEPMAARLLALAERWQGFLDVSIDVARDADGDGPGGPCDVDGPLADRVVRVVAEAITNAVRHGHASAIRIEVAVGQDDVRVVAVDDGTGPRSGSPGGGSGYLDVVAVGGSQGWTLSADPDGGARLEVRIR
jgi:signal transduction histidine kinase